MPIAIIIIVALTVANNYLEHDVHKWRYDGECLECHSEHEYVDKVKLGLSIPPSKYHTEQFRQYTHGKHSSAQSCSTCHKQKDCLDCHNSLPDSHTQDFVKPAGIGLERHIMLAKMGISSCLTCHQNFLKDCTPCHTPSEVKPWEEEGKKSLMKWENMYSVFRFGEIQKK